MGILIDERAEFWISADGYTKGCDLWSATREGRENGQPESTDRRAGVGVFAFGWL
jgi:hypothetical protein